MRNAFERRTRSRALFLLELHLVFNKPIDGILRRIIADELSSTWSRYLKFAIYVVGIGGGVRIWSFEKYLTVQEPYKEIVSLTSDRWMLEIYDTIIGTLQSTTMLLLVFFVFALVALVIVRVFELRRTRTDSAA